MPTIHINPADPASINAALNTEWLLTNGLGGYAMGTALGVNTRRYHGLLVAATKPPVGRIVALHSMIEQLIIPREGGSEEVIDLSTQQFVGPDGEPMLHPNGWRGLGEFQFDQAGLGSAAWHWKFDEVSVLKQLNLHPGRNFISLAFHYNILCDVPLRLRLRPLIALRDFHALDHEHGDFRLLAHARGCTVRRGQFEIDVLLPIELNPSKDPLVRWHSDEQWWRQFAYPLDRQRGQEWHEDVWSPGFIEARVKGTQFVPLSMSLGRTDSSNTEAAKRLQNLRLKSAQDDRERTSDARTMLSTSAMDFVVVREMGNASTTSVIAGYPWFGDWGRDTMISLPGLMLCTGRLDEARSTLLTFARSMKNGLIPNLFDDYGSGGAEHYNTVDASLWFVHAVRELWKAASKTDTELLKACRQIIAAYRRGTDFNIRMDPRDGLVAAGDPSTQLTWMDAKRDNIAFTPRNGKPVEINALWFNALRCLAEMTEDPRERDDLVSLSEKVAKSFREQFWWEERKCLHDVLSPPPGSGGDATSLGESFIGDRRLRPNQIFPVSLPYSPLTRDQQRAVVKIVGERLLTPFGLRTLDRDDPQYRGRYEGNLFDRDSAYHQGTVWPWLIGPYCEALLRVNDFNDDAKRQVRQIIQPLIDEMSNTSGGRCLNQIAEVYDGDPPHRPSGCPAQAWSVAEVLRIVTLLEPG